MYPVVVPISVSISRLPRLERLDCKQTWPEQHMAGYRHTSNTYSNAKCRLYCHLANLAKQWLIHLTDTVLRIVTMKQLTRLFAMFVDALFQGGKRMLIASVASKDDDFFWWEVLHLILD